MAATDGPRVARIRTLLLGNVAARIGALVALAVATVMVARVGGPTLVGAFTLLRVLPGLAGVLAALGLPGAAPYFLASRSENPSLRPTLVILGGIGAAAATLGWLILTPVLHRYFFADWNVGLVFIGALAVLTQLPVAVGKSLLQGEKDLNGANGAIIAEEAVYLPIYGVFLFAGPSATMMALALVVADIVVTIGIAFRLRHRGFFRDWADRTTHWARRSAGTVQEASSAACCPL